MAEETDVLEQLYLDLSAELLAKTQTKHVDIWENQVIEEDQEVPFNKPATFIEFENVDWKDITHKQQSGDMIIAIHVVYHSVANSHNGSANQDQALRVFRFLRQVHQALHNFSGVGYNKLSRVQTQKDRSAGPLQVYIVRFATKIHDVSAVEESDFVTDPPVDIRTGETPYVQDDTFVV